ncbi:FMN-binding protein [Nocardioides nematodiphilus]|uniref:FMN-binding protein n=1 Tax=Nocardioides nematodiphilus TaxID=2849669 RepID=UPI001CD91B01|nr:FMN-binding protein [Nocardioides nematodiphilus]MCA1983595.1 FMN-binding protein [Nocardioides nematodiphilus]
MFGALSTVTVVVLLFGYRTSTEGPGTTAALPAVTPATTTESSDTTPRSTPSTPSAPKATRSATAVPSTKTVVTGDQEQTQWGPVQVELTITGGSITSVAVPVYPNGNGRDAQINSFALPQLVQETISAQSASIDMISGATVTSDGYLRSLQSALDKAGL